MIADNPSGGDYDDRGLKARYDFERALESRLTSIERKLDEKVVIRDVYLAEKQAIHEALAYERQVRSTAIDEVRKDISELEGFRKAFYALLFTLLSGVLIAFVTWALSGGLR